MLMHGFEKIQSVHNSTAEINQLVVRKALDFYTHTTYRVLPQQSGNVP